MPNENRQNVGTQTETSDKPSGGSSGQTSIPTISLPKGGGAIRGIGEKFAANPVTGTGSMTVPIALTPGRSGFSPQLTLSYDSGSGNGPFGLGWTLSLPAVTRKTDKGLPRYQDRNESDVFILSGSEDLVPSLIRDGDDWNSDSTTRTVDGVEYKIQRYRPRTEGLFARVERWQNSASGQIHWRSISKDNISTVYGKTEESRVVDPDNEERVFSWLICESRDDKGNAIVYEYADENSAGIDLTQAHERNRTDQGRSANRYLKRIKYGNKTSHLVQPDLTKTAWFFEVVFDYDEGHYEPLPSAADDPQFIRANATGTHSWSVRMDPFSTFRAGFEVRTYRLCHRVLMFHHFPEELGATDYLVRSTEFQYDQTPIASFITSVTQSGYVRQADGSYLKKSLPPLEFDFSKAVIQTEVREMDASSLENLPYGLDGAKYQWTDLNGEGISGILTEQAAAWFYKPNLGGGTFGPVELVAKPSLADLSAGQQLLDLAGDGQLDLVQFARPLAGFHERTQEGSWSDFKAFSSIPNLNWRDPNLRFIDLTGDGHTDVLITEDEVFTWYPSLAKAGFGPAEHTQRQSLDEEKGPRLIFADGTQSIFLADFSGDGLVDLARVRNGEVCYWPNLGYGHFGAKVTMDAAPWFDAPDQFDERRIRLADIDGSGVTDIIYLKREGIDIYFNHSGNRFSEARHLEIFPSTNELNSILVVDLLGNGTACLVWSSPLPSYTRQPMRYIELMDQKPHLLTMMRNNMGAETHIHYASSTKFYLADKTAGDPWITRLPFPVHVIERIETLDRISRNRFVTRYVYHHGYFDGTEREFRGFGLVEKVDTEEFASLSTSDNLPNATNIDPVSHVPPVVTKTWYHTGAYFERGRISKLFEHQYYREGDPSRGEDLLTDEQLQTMLLPDTVLPDGLSIEEEREACRSLKGAVLRIEIYALDNKEESDRPYSVAERNYTITVVQPRSSNQHAVFFTHPRETIDFHYERKLYELSAAKRADPRVTHNAVLEVDDYGNEVKAVAISYGRRFDAPDPILTATDRARQKNSLLSFTENRYTNAVLRPDDYRSPLLCEARTFELLNVLPAANQPGITNLFRFEELRGKIAAASDGDHDLPYEDIDGAGAIANHPYRRLIENVRTLYRSDDLAGPLSFAQLEARALPFESYKLAFTPELLQQVYGNRVTDVMLSSEGGYVHSEGDNNWWIPSGRIFFSLNWSDTTDQEFDSARQHFFLTRRFLDTFGNRATVQYDNADILLTETRDPQGNIVQAQNDYRVMLPRLVTDPNGNRSTLAFDAFGLVVGTAVMGKTTENLGDSLTGFEADLDEATILAHLENPFANPEEILKRATTRVVYDLHRYRRTGEQPSCSYTLARETHSAGLSAGESTKIQHSFSYSDGLGRKIQNKVQAETGPITAGGPVINPRWVGSGWVVFNNKGKPVQQFEPFFSATHEFEFARTVGVSPILFYDPAGRISATLHPEHTYEKVLFDPWLQESWDKNDNVLQADPREDADVADVFSRLPLSTYLPTWHDQRKGGAMGSSEQAAAAKALKHAATPGISHIDTLGRTFLTVEHNKFERSGVTIEERYVTRVKLDIEGNQREVIDAKGRTIIRYDYDILGNRIHEASMEAGERWVLNDMANNPIRLWDSRGSMQRLIYDESRRPTELFVTEQGSERLVKKTIYGESAGVAGNHRMRVHQVFDSAGVVTSEAYDFKGNPLRSRRDLLPDYKQSVDWKQNLLANGGSFTSLTSYDALNRPVAVTTPDNSIYRVTFNEANLIDRVIVNLRGDAVATIFVTNVEYNAKGQRVLIAYGNGAQTSYDYDPLTFRLTKLTTVRPGNPDATAADTFKNVTTLQDARYTYDPVGNVVSIEDAALKTIFHGNEEIAPLSTYTYDAIYQLIEAQGREHIAQTAFDFDPPGRRDFPFLGLRANANDAQAMRNYTERYEYDEVGNFQFLRHVSTSSSWNRSYEYQAGSLLQPTNKSNRLTRTTANGQTEDYVYADELGNDVNGCITAINAMKMKWDFKGQLQQVDLGGGGKAYYVYDAAGQRVRKVIEDQNGARKQERIYLGSFEVYREYNAGGSTVALERESLNVMDDKKRLALVETQTQGNARTQLVRYQFGNHLGSTSLELDHQAQIISYEEYYPYGSTSFQVMRNQTEVGKRYRYVGKERDEESGFNYHGARYYASWIGRWVSCDPAGLRDGPNTYRYSRNSPAVLRDTNGMDPNLRDYQERSIQLNTSYDTSSRSVTYSLTIELQNPTTGDRFRYSSQGGLNELRSVHQQLAQNSGFTEALRPEEREHLFSSLESFAQSVGPVSPPVQGGLEEGRRLPSEDAPAEPSRPVDRALGAVGDVARGIEADRVLPQRYRLEPPRGATVTGIRDTQAGAIRGTPPRPVGAPVIRVDRPHGSTKYPHINIETLNPDPHYRISPGALRAAGRIARGFEAVGRVARPVAIVTDTVRIGAAIYEDEGIGRNTARTTASVAGGWGGAFAGAWAGAKGGALLGGAIGTIVPGLGNAAGAAIGGLVGGILGGIIGAYAGGAIGERAADAVLE